MQTLTAFLNHGYVRQVQTANIATAKNQFSRLIEQVKQGGSVLITERNRPVARLLPLAAADVSLASLHQAGVLQPPVREAWDVESFLQSLPADAAELSADQSLVAAVLAERAESR
jgi:prevent-host-death family protein